VNDLLYLHYAAHLTATRQLWATVHQTVWSHVYADGLQRAMSALMMIYFYRLKIGLLLSFCKNRFGKRDEK